MKSKVIIFGCGYQGKTYFKKLNADFNVIAFADNNKKLWGTELFGKPVISPDDIQTDENTMVIVCVEFGFIDIAKQLESLHISCIINRCGVCYRYQDTVLYPVSLKRNSPYKKSGNELSVLFVQEVVCGRTDKISSILKEKGVMTQNAFFTGSSLMPQAYHKENAFYSYDDLLDFANKSDFDIVHCSNEPDILTNLLLQSNKKIVYDAHDIITARNNTADQSLYYFEYAASRFSDGYMCTDNCSRDLQAERYGIPFDHTFTIYNLPLESQLILAGQRKPKLSAEDGELHMVYEGGISDNPKSHRFFEAIWEPITASRIHIHYYSQQNVDYCMALEKTSPFLHYEGNLSGKELIFEMTQYDIGSILLNPVDKNADMAYPNKLYEYLAAGLPVVSNLTAASDFAQARQVGGRLDFDGDIAKQLRKLAAMRIPENYLPEHKLTMDSYADDIIAFYKRIRDNSKAVKR